MFEIAQENKKLSEPLTRALKEVEKLRHELANYQKDKMSLQNAKSRCALLAAGRAASPCFAPRRLACQSVTDHAAAAEWRRAFRVARPFTPAHPRARPPPGWCLTRRLHVLETQLRDLTWEHEVLEQRFGSVEKERDELYEHFESTIYEVQQKSGFKNILLEKKLEAQVRAACALACGKHALRCPG